MPLISMIWLATRWFRIIGLEVDIRASAELRQRLLVGFVMASSEQPLARILHLKSARASPRWSDVVARFVRSPRLLTRVLMLDFCGLVFFGD